MIGKTMTAIAAVALVGTVALAGGPGRGEQDRREECGNPLADGLQV